MHRDCSGCRIELVDEDITWQRVDAIVNAANSALQAGGGVDGAVHRAAGPELQRSLDRQHPGGCATGEAVATPGFDLPAAAVIHAVGPRWRGGRDGEPEQLAATYAAVFREAAKLPIRSIAIPAISCGVFGYPIDRAAEVAMKATADELIQGTHLRSIRFVLFGEGAFGAFARAMEGLEWPGSVHRAEGAQCP